MELSSLEFVQYTYNGIRIPTILLRIGKPPFEISYGSAILLVFIVKCLNMLDIFTPNPPQPQLKIMSETADLFVVVFGFGI